MNSNTSNYFELYVVVVNYIYLRINRNAVVIEVNADADEQSAHALQQDFL